MTQELNLITKEMGLLFVNVKLGVPEGLHDCSNIPYVFINSVRPNNNIVKVNMTDFPMKFCNALVTLCWWMDGEFLKPISITVHS